MLHRYVHSEISKFLVPVPIADRVISTVNTTARRDNFSTVSGRLFDALNTGESLTTRYAGENSQFIRFNTGRVRQSGTVNDAKLALQLFHAQRNAELFLPITGVSDDDSSAALDGLQQLRAVLEESPDDPLQQLPQNHGVTNEAGAGYLLEHSDAVRSLVSEFQGMALSGFYAAGPIFRGTRNSAGQDHWFSSANFSFDYTLLADSERSVKGIFAGANWDQQDYANEIARAREQLQSLELEPKTIEPGRYRCYLAPAAVAELVDMLSWEGLSEASIQQGTSALAGLRESRSFSPLFNLSENFSGAVVPRFNEDGELAETVIPVIVGGELRQTLVNSRSSKEYGVAGNAANSHESFRSPEIATGDLAPADVYERIDTGIYVANLHYLNWSDRFDARITGMTRYACFWIENGRIAAPIEDLRFDDSLYSIFGDRLLAVSDRSDFIPSLSTYGRRALGGTRTPGLLVDGMSFTL